MKLIKKLRVAVLYGLICSSNAIGGTYTSVVTKMPSIEAAGARQDNIGKDSYLLAIDGKNKSALFLSVMKNEYKYAPINFFSSGRNLIQISNEFVFSAIDWDGTCSIRKFTPGNKMEILLLKNNCTAEVFSLSDGFAAWTSEISGQKITFFNSDGVQKKNVSLINIGKFITSIASYKSDIYGVSQQNSSDENLIIFKLEKNKIVKKLKQIKGAGGQLMSNGEDLIMLFNRNGDPYLIAFDAQLNVKWETQVTKILRWGTNASLLVENGRIFFVGGNDGRLYVATFDNHGKKLNEVQDDNMKYPTPQNGYAVALMAGKLQIMGVIDEQTNKNGPSTAVVRFFIDMNLNQ